MREKLLLLEEKVTEILSRLENLKEDNDMLRREKADLESQLASLRRDFDSLQLSHNDQSSQVKAKLTSVLDRIEELEKVGF